MSFFLTHSVCTSVFMSFRVFMFYSLFVRLCFISDILLICIAASLFNKLTYLLTYLLTSVWGCGRRRAALVESHAEQRTEKWFISLVLRLNCSTEQSLGKVSLSTYTARRVNFNICLQN